MGGVTATAGGGGRSSARGSAVAIRPVGSSGTMRRYTTSRRGMVVRKGAGTPSFVRGEKVPSTSSSLYVTVQGPTRVLRYPRHTSPFHVPCCFCVRQSTTTRAVSSSPSARITAKRASSSDSSFCSISSATAPREGGLVSAVGSATGGGAPRGMSGVGGAGAAWRGDVGKRRRGHIGRGQFTVLLRTL